MTDSEISLYFGNSYETSDFIVDCLEIWWKTHKDKKYKHIEELVINLDNWPSQKSNRTQFIKRIVEFSRKIQMPIHLVYYPPYHSKYNPIEHTFWVLERYWNGEILDSVDAVLKYASNMKLNGNSPNVKLIDKEYHLWVKLTKKELKPFRSSFLQPGSLSAWNVLVMP